MNPEHYCLDKAAPPGSNLYYCLLYQAKQNKRGLCALFAFEYELEQIIAKNTDTGVSGLQLQWWLHEIDRVFHNASQHPIGIELVNVLRRETLDRHLLMHSIHATERHIQGGMVEDYPAWIDRFGAYKGNIRQAAAMLCACKSSDSLNISGKVGRILALLDVLQTLPRYLHRGLCPLPLNAMQQHGVTAKMLQQNSRQASVHALFAHLITNMADRLLALQEQMPPCDRKKLVFCRVAIRLALALCDEIRRDHYRLLDNRIMLTPLRKLWLAWRTK